MTALSPIQRTIPQAGGQDRCTFIFLSRAYGYAREQVADALGGLMSCREFRVESPDLAILALQDYRRGTADFSDYLLGRAHQRLGAAHTVTFDRKAAEASQFKLLA